MSHEKTNGKEAISKLIPWPCASDQSCLWSLSLFWAKSFTGKLCSLEISNFSHPAFNIPWNTPETFLKHHWIPWNSCQTSFKDPWNPLQTPLKQPSILNFVEIPLKLFWNTLETSLKHPWKIPDTPSYWNPHKTTWNALLSCLNNPWNFHETPLKFPWNFLETPCKLFWNFL